MENRISKGSPDDDDEDSPSQSTRVARNVSGNWPGFGVSYQIAQNGTYVTVQEISPSYMGPIVTAAGQGTISGGHMEVQYTTILGTAGRAQLELSDDGYRLTGTFSDFSSGAVLNADLRR